MRTLITYQAPDGQTIRLTPNQAQALRRSGLWPTNHLGQGFDAVVAQFTYRRASAYSDDELHARHPR